MLPVKTITSSEFELGGGKIGLRYIYVFIHVQLQSSQYYTNAIATKETKMYNEQSLQITWDISMRLTVLLDVIFVV